MEDEQAYLEDQKHPGDAETRQDGLGNEQELNKNPKLDNTRPSKSGLERSARCTQERYTLDSAVLGCTRLY